MVVSSSIAAQQVLEGKVEQHDVERIARATLRELGVVGATLVIAPEMQPGQWRIEIQGTHGPGRLRIKCGERHFKGCLNVPYKLATTLKDLD